MKLKRFFQVVIIIALMSSLVVAPAAAAWPFDDVISAVNESIIPWLDGFITTLMGVLVPIVMFLLYPIIIIVNLLYEIASMVYTNAAIIYNFFVGIPNFISVIMVSWLPDEWPSVWTVLFLMSVTLAVFGRVMRFIQYIKSWIPILFG